jgi:hypothetical protein
MFQYQKTNPHNGAKRGRSSCSIPIKEKYFRETVYLKASRQQKEIKTVSEVQYLIANLQGSSI